MICENKPWWKISTENWTWRLIWRELKCDDFEQILTKLCICVVEKNLKSKKLICDMEIGYEKSERHFHDFLLYSESKDGNFV